MRLKSRGLGRKELVMDFREYQVVREGDEIVVVGTIHEPVRWDFSIRVCEDDLAGMLKLALKRPTRKLLLRAVLHPRRHAHWSDERADHLAVAKDFRAQTKARLHTDGLEALTGRPRLGSAPVSFPPARGSRPAPAEPAALAGADAAVGA